MNTRTILTKARALIKKGWAQGAFARDKDGKIALIKGKQATCFCITGAVCRISSSYIMQGDCFESLKRALRLPTLADVARWNDAPGRTQAEVLAAFDKAIALARAEQVQ